MSLSVHIRKKAGDFRLAIDFEHEDGITGILGASGCGKSMTLKCIAGIIKPDEGRIVLNGRVLFDSQQGINLKPQERNVGYLFQNYALFPNMTVEQNILCGLSKEKNKNIRREKMEQMLAVMELTAYRKQYPHQLSGGQQQRTALARILVNEPELMLLDEPFSALDSYLSEQLQTQVRGILDKFGKDVLMVSHSRDEVYYLCGKTAVMHQGCILNMAPTKQLFADPGSRTAAVLTGCKNIAAAEKSGDYQVYVPDWGIYLDSALPVRDDICAVGLRAHYFYAEGNKEETRSEANKTEKTENLWPVVYAAEREDPFEVRLQFRYAKQKPGTADLWWRIPKDRRPKEMPKQLGIAAADVLLLYPEEKAGGNQ